jgi:hypothetical protein
VNRVSGAALERFERQGRAAQELWARGYPAECSLLMRDGLRELMQRFGASDDLPAARAADLERLLDEFQVCGDLSGDVEYTRAHAAWLERARQLWSDLAGELRRDPRQRSRRQLAAAGAGAFVLIVAVAVWLELGRRPSAVSSTPYSSEFGAEQVVDGVLATEWLLPDGKLGWLELNLPKQRAVHDVVLRNSHNRHFLDRATRRARVTLFDGQKQLASSEIAFAKLEEKSAPVRVNFGGQRGNRIRIEILEHFGLGAGLAEIELE